MTTTRSKSNQSILSEMRFYPIIDVCMLNELRAFFREALQEAGIITYRQLMKFLKDDLEDMLKINALKNYKGELINKEAAEELIRCYFYINLLQNGFGPIADGLFDITLKDADDFETFYDNVLDSIVYNVDKARKRQAKRIQRERVEANVKALHSEHHLKLLVAQLSTTRSVSGSTSTGIGSFGQSLGLPSTPTGATIQAFEFADHMARFHPLITQPDVGDTSLQTSVGSTSSSRKYLGNDHYCEDGPYTVVETNYYCDDTIVKIKTGPSSYLRVEAHHLIPIGISPSNPQDSDDMGSFATVSNMGSDMGSARTGSTLWTNGELDQW